MSYEQERIAVTGIGVICPIGDSVQKFWNNLQNGKNGIRKITHFDPKTYPSNFGGEVDITDEHLNRFKSRKTAKRLDKYMQYGYLAGTEALDDAGIATEIEKNPGRYASLISTGAGGVYAFNYGGYESVAKGLDAVHPLTIVNCIPNTCAGYFAQEHNLQGPSFSLASACSTGNYSIATAITLIKSGLIDGAFVGGSEAAICPLGIASFGNIFALSRRTDSPETASRPYDKGRDGFVMGAGAGVLCIERMDLAQRRGAKIYCEISGFGWSCDAHDLVAPHPNGDGAARAIRMALKQTAIDPTDIGLINTHSTSTVIGDLSEYKSVRQVFGDYATKVPVHSTKSMIGHLLGGAGGVEAIAAIMAFEQGVMHHTINQFEQDPEIQFNVIKDAPREERPKHILSNGFGFGGQNASIILSQFVD